MTYVCQIDTKDVTNLTNYIIVYLLLYTGVRRTELSNIKIVDVDVERNCIYLNNTKTNKFRIVFYKSTLVKYLKKYISMNPDREYLLWDFNKNQHITPENITAKFRYMNKKLKFRRLTPHMLRHTFATLLVENGATVHAVQRLLGHSSSKTTDIYLHMSVKRIKKDFDNYFPYM